MIYFDNAATSLQKPREVYWAMQAAMQQAGGYGRSGHRPALRAGELVYECRELAARLFGLEAPEQVVFTMNATHALNQAIHALTEETTRAAVTGYEHNSVIRPLTERGIPYRVMKHGPFDGGAMLACARQALTEGANLFIVNHMSNVFGGVIPLEALDDLLADAGVPMIVDASQSAGAVEIDAGRLKSAAAICMPGHKGLLGPQGTGMLLVCSEKLERPLMQGGGRAACRGSCISLRCCRTALKAAPRMCRVLRGSRLGCAICFARVWTTSRSTNVCLKTSSRMGWERFRESRPFRIRGKAEYCLSGIRRFPVKSSPSGWPSAASVCAPGCTAHRLRIGRPVRWTAVRCALLSGRSILVQKCAIFAPQFLRF